MSVDYSLIGARIKAQRKQMHMTQEQLAEALNVSVGYISQIERGITKANLDMLSNICVKTNNDLASLFLGSTIENSRYLVDELTEKCSKLSTKQKYLLLKMIDLILEYDE